MSRRALLERLKKQAEQSSTDETVRQISQLMDELSAAVVDGQPVPEMTLAELMEDSHVPKDTRR